jgi:nucleotidyltransferase substrate binding protein (TIGR01987 family)
MNNQDIRWQQRFQQFEKAFALLQMAIAIEKPSIIERAGLVQCFEITFELARRLLKDYLRAEGFIVNSSRHAIKQAFQSGLISAGHDWIDALHDRNLTTHTYNEQTATAVEQKIRQVYYPFLQELQRIFADKMYKC